MELSRSTQIKVTQPLNKPIALPVTFIPPNFADMVFYIQEQFLTKKLFSKFF